MKSEVTPIRSVETQLRESAKPGIAGEMFLAWCLAKAAEDEGRIPLDEVSPATKISKLEFFNYLRQINYLLQTNADFEHVTNVLLYQHPDGPPTGQDRGLLLKDILKWLDTFEFEMLDCAPDCIIDLTPGNFGKSKEILKFTAAFVNLCRDLKLAFSSREVCK